MTTSTSFFNPNYSDLESLLDDLHDLARYGDDDGILDEALGLDKNAYSHVEIGMRALAASEINKHYGQLLSNLEYAVTEVETEGATPCSLAEPLQDIITEVSKLKTLEFPKDKTTWYKNSVQAWFDSTRDAIVEDATAGLNKLSQ